MIKIISMDFDGTLLTSNKRISNKTRNSLIKYKNKSYKIIGITARNLMSVNNILDTSMPAAHIPADPEGNAHPAAPTPVRDTDPDDSGKIEEKSHVFLR